MTAREQKCWTLPVVGALSTLLCAPFVRSVFWLGDEGVILHGADRLLQGKYLYQDFFEFLPPGAFLITAGWFGVLGASWASARFLAILTITGIACLTFWSSRRTSGRTLIAALVTLGWVVASQG